MARRKSVGRYRKKRASGRKKTRAKRRKPKRSRRGKKKTVKRRNRRKRGGNGFLYENEYDDMNYIYGGAAQDALAQRQLEAAIQADAELKIQKENKIDEIKGRIAAHKATNPETEIATSNLADGTSKALKHSRELKELQDELKIAQEMNENTNVEKAQDKITSLDKAKQKFKDNIGVDLGPQTTPDENNWWLDLIRDIDGNVHPESKFNDGIEDALIKEIGVSKEDLTGANGKYRDMAETVEGLVKALKEKYQSIYNDISPLIKPNDE